MLPGWYDLCTHAIVPGSPRLGKSKFLELGIRAQIDAGNPCCIVDWHGPLYRDTLNYLAYVQPERPIVLLNMAQPDFITPYNPFRRNGADPSAQASTMTNALINVWGLKRTEDLPTYERVANMLFYYAIVSGEPIHHAAKLLRFHRKDLREKAIEIIEDPDIKDDWREFQSASRTEWKHDVLSTRNRLGRFIRSKTLKRFMGIKGMSLDIGKAIDDGVSILVNLGHSDSLDREAAKTFATLFLNDFFQEAMKRVDKPKPYFLYLDECQNYLRTFAADMLEQVLKSGLRITMAYHHLAQFHEDPHLQQAIKSTAKIKAIFGGSPYEQGVELVHETWLDKVNERQIKETYYRTITKYEEEFYTTDTTTALEAEGETPAGPSKNKSAGGAMLMGTRYAPRQEKEKAMDVEWSRDEKVSRCAEMLIKQPRQHCFLKLGDAPIEPFDVPFVEEFLSHLHNPDRVLPYEQFLNRDALPAAEVDRLLIENERQFLNNATKEYEPDGPKRPVSRKNLFPGK